MPGATLVSGNAPISETERNDTLYAFRPWISTALLLLALAAELFLTTQSAFAQCCVITEVQPNYGRGGRIVAIAISPGNLNTLVVASFSGGLFKSSDGGTTWRHMDSFSPNRVADVKFNPEDENLLIATVAVDSHNPSYSGIWRSEDGGQTWTPENTDMPSCDAPPHPALGGRISFGPGPNVFVATSCGLAVSHDKGVTWSHPFYDSSPGEPAVTTVTSRPGPQYPLDPNSVVVDFCGARGPRRSVDNATSFGPLPAIYNYPIDYCSIVTSPYEPFVLLAVSSAGILWESDDAGVTWARILTFNVGARRPWVVARPAFNGEDTQFYLYFHNGGDLFRKQCKVLNSGPAPAGTALRCTQNDQGDFWGTAGMHDHHAEGFSLENCTIFDANDTGMSHSTCGPPWSSINTGLAALQIYNMAGTVHPDHTDLYIGTQDNYVAGSNDGGLTWPFLQPTEGFNLQAPHARSSNDEQVSGNSCGPPCPTFIADPKLSLKSWSPPTEVGSQAWIYLIGGGDGSSPTYATTGGPCTINGTTANPCLYTCDTTGSCQARVGLPPLATPHLYIAGPPARPTIYAVTSKGTNSLGQGIRGLVRITDLNCPSTGCPNADNGLGSLYIWAPDDNPYDYPVVFGVDPGNPLHLMGADLTDQTMKFSVDAGVTWQTDSQLTNLVTNQGQLLFHTPFLGLQSHVIAFDPSNGKHILIGTEANGVIASVNGGNSWFKVPGSDRIPAISDFFFDEVRHTVYVSSYGRGLWTISGLDAIPIPFCVLYPWVCVGQPNLYPLDPWIEISSTIFDGIIQEINPLESRVVIRVDHVYAPEIAATAGERFVTASFRYAKSLAVGEQWVFFANTGILGESRQPEVLGLLSIEEAKDLSARITHAGEVVSEQRFRRRVRAAELVLSGEVVDVKPLVERGAAKDSGQWMLATVQIVKVLKGNKSLKTVGVTFPRGKDSRWVGTPRFGVGDKGILILRRVHNDKKEYRAPSFQDFLLPSQLSWVEKVLK